MDSVRYDVAGLRVPMERMGRWWPAVAMIGVVALALFFRLYRLDTFLHWAFGDEMSYGVEGQRVISGQYTGLFAFTWDQAPTTYAYMLAFVQDLFGPSLHTDRVVSVLLGTLAAPLVALCARELELSWTSALLAAGLLAVSHWHAHFSRMTLPAITCGFALLLALYSLLAAYRRGYWWLFLLSGVLCGFAPYVFLSNRALPGILLLWFLYLLVFQFGWVRLSWRMILIFAGTCVLVLLPLVIFWLQNWGWFLGPEQHVGVLYNKGYWGGQHPGLSTSTVNIVLHQLPLAAGMFMINGGPYPPWGGTFAPAMDVVTGWLLVPAIAYACVCWRRPLVVLLLIWFGLIWFTGVVLTLDAPQMEHAVGLIPAAFLLIALLFDAAGRQLAARTHRALIPAAAALLLLLSGILNYRAYFGDWGSQLAGDGGFTWQFYDAARFVGQHATPHGTAIYSWGYPDEFFRFLAPHAGEFPATDAAFKPASLYIIIAGASTSPATVAARVPGARLQRVYDADGSLAFTAVLPPAP